MRLLLPLVKISCDDIFMVRFMLPLTEILYGSFFIVRLVLPLTAIPRDDAFIVRFLLFGLLFRLQKCGVMALFIMRLILPFAKAQCEAFLMHSHCACCRRRKTIFPFEFRRISSVCVDTFSLCGFFSRLRKCSVMVLFILRFLLPPAAMRCGSFYIALCAPARENAAG